MQSLKSSSRLSAGNRTVPSLQFSKALRKATVVMSSPAPKTGFHTVSDDLATEALGLFFDDASSYKVSPTTGGVNNCVQYVDTPSGERYVLRVYNNGNQSAKVYFEHGILDQLQLQQADLSFKVPKALRSKNGKTHELVSSGAEACIFELIPGSLAKTTSPEEVGRATGELCTAMAKVRLAPHLKGQIPPYAEVFGAHHAIGGNKELFYNEVATNPEFNVCRESIDYLIAEIRLMEEKIKRFLTLGLPTQLIHGDLHYDNVMVVGDTVSGLLDFEFCVYDWRAMELAVALSKYVGEDEPLPLIERFVEGYVKTGELEDKEIEIMPDLISLRIFSNVIYFTGRAIAGEDTLESLTSRAGTYAKRVRWCNANYDKVVAAIKTRLATIKAAAKEPAVVAA